MYINKYKYIYIYIYITYFQAGGLIGSPTVPRQRREDLSYLVTNCSSYFINKRMAVGAV